MVIDEPMPVTRDDANFVDDDDLQAELARSRLEALKKQAAAPASIDEIALAAQATRSTAAPEETSTGNGLVISSTSEFVRTLGMAAEDEDEDDERANGSTAAGASSGGSSVGSGGGEASRKRPHDEVDAHSEEDEDDEDDDDEDDHDTMEDGEIGSHMPPPAPRPSTGAELDPVAEASASGHSGGVFAALALLKSRGMLEAVTAETKEREERHKAHVQWEIEVRKRELERERERKTKRSSASSSSSRDGPPEGNAPGTKERERLAEAVRKFEHYTPDVRLEYTDHFGRNLDQKDAFRQLSHKFHRKPPGKKKMERLLRKIQSEIQSDLGTAVDTPLNTLAGLQKHTQESGTAHMVLSTGHKGYTASIRHHHRPCC